MHSAEMDIGELADAAGLSRRTVRFYVAQGLIAPASGRGRGSHYEGKHLAQLQQIGQLQAAGHSLDAIRQIMAGEQTPAPVAPPALGARPRHAAMSAELWTRLRLASGVELQFDASRFNPPVEVLLAIRQIVRDGFISDERKQEPERNSNGTIEGD